jgi:hypothetical protein
MIELDYLKLRIEIFHLCVGGEGKFKYGFNNGCCYTL